MATPRSPRLRATKEAMVKTAFAIVYLRATWREWAQAQKQVRR